MASAVGIISAAPAPWIARAATAQARSCEAPIAVVATAKITAPMRKMRRIPKRSPSRPPNTISAAGGRMFAVISHCDWEMSACRPASACGAASGTAVWSTRIIELASVIAARVIFMFRREVVTAAAAYVRSGASPRKLGGDLGEPRRGLVALGEQRFVDLPVDPDLGVV